MSTSNGHGNHAVVTAAVHVCDEHCDQRIEDLFDPLPVESDYADVIAAALSDDAEDIKE